MPQKSWSEKRERQYDHIKDGLTDRGRSEDEAEEIAARTVNKERARSGESEQASEASTQDISKAQLYAEARSKDIKGRSSMTKAELERAVGR